MTQEEELQALRKENPLLKALLAQLRPLKEQLAQTTARIKELEALLAKDSRTAVSLLPLKDWGTGDAHQVCRVVRVRPAASARKDNYEV